MVRRGFHLVVTAVVTCLCLRCARCAEITVCYEKSSNHSMLCSEPTPAACCPESSTNISISVYRSYMCNQSTGCGEPSCCTRDNIITVPDHYKTMLQLSFANGSCYRNMNSSNFVDYLPYNTDLDFIVFTYTCAGETTSAARNISRLLVWILTLSGSVTIFAVGAVVVMKLLGCKFRRRRPCIKQPTIYNPTYINSVTEVQPIPQTTQAFTDDSGNVGIADVTRHIYDHLPRNIATFHQQDRFIMSTSVGSVGHDPARENDYDHLIHRP